MRQKSIEIENFGHAAPIPAASRVGPILMTSGVGGKNPADGKLPSDIDSQARFAFVNLERLLKAGGMDMGDVVKIGCFVTDDKNREVINKYWVQYYPDAAKRPARHTIEMPLRGGMLIQLEALAVAKDA